MLPNRKSLIAIAVLSFTSNLAIVPPSVAQTPAYPNVEIDCLGETVDIYRYNFETSERLFFTPSGISHLIDYVEWDETWVAQDFRMWFGHGISPGANNGILGERGVRQFTGHMKLFPVEGNDGPSFQYNLRLKLTANANGEVKVFYQPQSTDDWNIRCVGPK